MELAATLMNEVMEEPMEELVSEPETTEPMMELAVVEENWPYSTHPGCVVLADRKIMAERGEYQIVLAQQPVEVVLCLHFHRCRSVEEDMHPCEREA